MPIDISTTEYNNIRATWPSTTNEIVRQLILAADQIDLAWTHQEAQFLVGCTFHLETALELLKELMGIGSSLASGTIAPVPEIKDATVQAWLPGVGSPTAMAAVQPTASTRIAPVEPTSATKRRRS